MVENEGNCKMIAVCCQALYRTPRSYTADEQLKSKVVRIPPTSFPGNGGSKITVLTRSTKRNLVSAASPTEVSYAEEVRNRQNIPRKKKMVDPFRQGIIIERGVGYSQTVVIRSYAVGADKTAILESILNHLQETALNHVWMSGLLADGFGATHSMVRNNLIWVVTRMQVEVDDYPIWGEVMEVETWVGASGKNGMRRDWMIRSKATGEIIVRATSTWVMMNKQTRRLSKMPDEVKDELSTWFIDKKANLEKVVEKTDRLETKAKYVNSNLKPKRSDLDMNHHVNNVKYVNWMLETIPCDFLEDYQLSGITLEYRKESGSSDMVQSLCEPQGFEEITEDSLNAANGNALASYYKSLQRFTRVLQITGERRNEEIMFSYISSKFFYLKL